MVQRARKALRVLALALFSPLALAFLEACGGGSLPAPETGDATATTSTDGAQDVDVFEGRSQEVAVDALADALGGKDATDGAAGEEVAAEGATGDGATSAEAAPEGAIAGDAGEDASLDATNANDATSVNEPTLVDAGDATPADASDAALEAADGLSADVLEGSVDASDDSTASAFDAGDAGQDSQTGGDSMSQEAGGVNWPSADCEAKTAALLVQLNRRPKPQQRVMLQNPSTGTVTTKLPQAGICVCGSGP